MATVLTVGMATADFIFRVEHLPSDAKKYRADEAGIVGGGCAANASVAIERLGGHACLVARLGDDAIGDIIAADLYKEGVDTSLVDRACGGQSSYSSVSIDRRGERQIVNFRGHSLREDADFVTAVPEVDAVLVDTRWIEGAIAALELARGRGIPAIVDAEAPIERAILESATHIAFSKQGLLSLYKGSDIESALFKTTASLSAFCCVTDGDRGTFYIENERLIRLPTFKVEAVDTLGAGDIWHGAFALMLAEKVALREAMLFANAAAAIKCTRFGGRLGCPTRAETEKLVKEKL